MIDMANEVCRILGGGVVVTFICILFYEAINKFNRWRKNGCKIKCLCKPHVYEIEWHWSKDGETLLVCKKCGKKKILFIDFDSYKKAED